MRIAVAANDGVRVITIDGAPDWSTIVGSDAVATPTSDLIVVTGTDGVPNATAERIVRRLVSGVPTLPPLVGVVAIAGVDADGEATDLPARVLGRLASGGA